MDLTSNTRKGLGVCRTLPNLRCSPSHRVPRKNPTPDFSKSDPCDFPMVFPQSFLVFREVSGRIPLVHSSNQFPETQSPRNSGISWLNKKKVATILSTPPHSFIHVRWAGHIGRRLMHEQTAAKEGNCAVGTHGCFCFFPFCFGLWGGSLSGTHKFRRKPTHINPQGRGCQNRFGIRFWLVGEFTTHFRPPILVLESDVHWKRFGAEGPTATRWIKTDPSRVLHPSCPSGAGVPRSSCLPTTCRCRPEAQPIARLAPMGPWLVSCGDANVKWNDPEWPGKGKGKMHIYIGPFWLVLAKTNGGRFLVYLVV